MVVFFSTTQTFSCPQKMEQNKSENLKKKLKSCVASGKKKQ